MASPLKSRSSREHRRNDSLPNHHPSNQFPYRRSVGIRRGPLWISAGILISVPLLILNLQLWIYQDPALQGDAWVDTQHWKPPSRILAETPVAKCIQWETTGQLVWVQRDVVQVLVIDADDQWWFEPAQKETVSSASNATIKKLQLFHGPVLWPPPTSTTQQQQSPQVGATTADLYHFASMGGDDVSPWYGAQRIVQERLGIPSSLLKIEDYQGMRGGDIPPIAKDHWMFLGRIPLMQVDAEGRDNDWTTSNNIDNFVAGELSGYMYTYIWKLQQPQLPEALNSQMQVLSLAEVMKAMAEQRFTGMYSLASLAIAMAHVNTNRLSLGQVEVDTSIK